MSHERLFNYYGFVKGLMRHSRKRQRRSIRQLSLLHNLIHTSFLKEDTHLWTNFLVNKHYPDYMRLSTRQKALEFNRIDGNSNWQVIRPKKHGSVKITRITLRK
jgi:hypothetical protein